MDKWKQLFQSHILERGWDYCESGAVTKITPTKTGYHAIVEGSEEYEVEIEIEDGEICDMQCSCPYAEDGNYCKHMAAVLYEMEEEENEELVSAKKSELWVNRYQEMKQELSDTIQKIPEEKVRKLLLELAQESESLRNRILTQYADHVSKRLMVQLKKEIDNIAYQQSDRYGFVDWNHISDYARGMEDFLDYNVQTFIDNGWYMEAFELTNAVFVKVGNQDMDDSGGESEMLADSCYEYWKKILENCGETDKKNMYDWFEKNQSAGIVVDYMEEYIGDFLMNEFHDENLLRQKLAMLDKLIDNAGDRTDSGSHWSSYYGYEDNLLKRIEIMKELRCSEEEIQEYKQKHWKFAAVRKMQLSEYLEENRLSEAVSLLQQCKEMDKDSPKRVEEYSARLIELYRKLDMEREYKEELIFQVFTCRQKNLDFVEMLKAVCTQDEWETYRERVLSDETGQSIRYSLMEKEGLYDRLLNEIMAQNSMYELDQYEKVLKERFPEKLRDIYVKYVKGKADSAACRNSYRDLMQYLKKIKKYPDGDRVTAEIAAAWRVEYRRRPAMLDELQKAGF